MAVVRGVGKTQNSLSLRVEDLDFPANQYGYIYIYITTGGSSPSQAYGGNLWSGTYTFTGLNPGTTYYFYAETKYGTGTRTLPTVAYTTESAPVVFPPSTPSIVKSGSPSGGNQTFTISFGANTTRVYIDRSWSTTISSATGTTSSGSFQVTYAIPTGSHTIRVYAENQYGSSAWSSYLSVVMPDTTKPTLSITTDGYNAITVNMTSSDDSGQFRNPKYSMYLDGSLIAQTNSNTFTYDRTADGTLLQTGVSYLVRVDVYDAANNFATVSKSVTVTRIRPSEMYWDTAKVSGMPFSLLATEWNRLTNRINEFRQYRGYVTLSFTTAVRNADVTADIYNQARNNINTMQVTIPVPPTKSRGQDVNAADIDRLRTSLNSVA